MGGMERKNLILQFVLQSFQEFGLRVYVIGSGWAELCNDFLCFKKKWKKGLPCIVTL